MLGILYGVGCRMAAARRATLLRRRGFGVPRNKSDLTILECKEIPDARSRASLWIAGGSRGPTESVCARHLVPQLGNISHQSRTSHLSSGTDDDVPASDVISHVKSPEPCRPLACDYTCSHSS